MAKMTPFRSYIVAASVAGAVAILGTVQMKGGVITYVIVSFLTGLCVSKACNLCFPIMHDVCADIMTVHSGQAWLHDCKRQQKVPVCSECQTFASNNLNPSECRRRFQLLLLLVLLRGLHMSIGGFLLRFCFGGLPASASPWLPQVPLLLKVSFCVCQTTDVDMLGYVNCSIATCQGQA